MSKQPVTLLGRLGTTSLKGLRAAESFEDFTVYLHNSIGKAMLVATGQEVNLPPDERPPPVPPDVAPVMRATFLKLAMLLEDARVDGVLEAGENGTFEQMRTATIAAFEKHLNKHLPPPAVAAAMQQFMDAAQEEHEKTCPHCKAAKEKGEAKAGETLKQELDACRSRTNLH